MHSGRSGSRTHSLPDLCRFEEGSKDLFGVEVALGDSPRCRSLTVVIANDPLGAGDCLVDRSKRD